ncbi:hypothetical protein LTR66_005301 [Elasticomyces elasticus]|nr:hypothetical protein LTR50_000100 [Elasticomyces elasticus]KAK4994726.1 hypothetical protein LTR66_005301 [Elasticomyces elasticus]
MTAKLKRADLGHLVSRWFPTAELDVLLDLTYFVGWMYLVDDQIDQLAGSREHAEDFRAMADDTITYAEQLLGLRSKNKPVTALHPGVYSFQRTAEALRDRYTVDQRELFIGETAYTMKMYALENDFRVAQRLPTLDEYWSYREGTSCCAMVIAMVEFANGLRIPPEVMRHPIMESVRKQANFIHWIANDILSAKKELREGFAENLIVLYSGPECRGQTGMDTAVDHLEKAIQQFEVAASDAMKYWKYDEELSRVIGDYIIGCKLACVGSIDWSVQTFRYGLGEAERDAEGGLTIVL